MRSVENGRLPTSLHALLPKIRHLWPSLDASTFLIVPGLSSLPGRCRSSLREIASAPSSKNRARPLGGHRRPLVACGIGKVTAQSSLMSMRRDKQHASLRFPVIQRSLQFGVDGAQVCAPGYTGRKRGEVVRTRTTVLQMHTRQWAGTGCEAEAMVPTEMNLPQPSKSSRPILQHFASPIRSSSGPS